MNDFDNDISTILSLQDKINKYFTNKYARLTYGKYKGRIAKLDGAIVDHRRGILVCCMVTYKNDRTQLLNSDIQSRMYRSLDEFEIVSF